MLTSVTRNFPTSWRFTAAVERSGGTDKWGALLPTVTHFVDDCMISSIRSDDLPRSDDPETTAWIHAPLDADFMATDVVEVPTQPGLLRGRFIVTGRPAPTPLGTAVPLREG